MDKGDKRKADNVLDSFYAELATIEVEPEAREGKVVDEDEDTDLADFYAEIAEAERAADKSEDVAEREGPPPPVISSAATISRSAALKKPEDLARCRAAEAHLDPLPPPPMPPPGPSEPLAPPTHAPTPSGPTTAPSTDSQRTGVVRKAAGKTWVDTQLSEWPENDFRIFVGNLGTEVNDSTLSSAFKRYESFNMAKVMKNSRDGKTKGFGFVSLGSAQDGAMALREMQGQYVGSRPVLVKKAAPEARTVTDGKGRAVTRMVNNKRRKRHIGY